MKININEFRVDAAQTVEAPLDFNTLVALLAQHQAATPTARLARDVEASSDHPEHNSHPAVAVLLTGVEQTAATGSAHGSFHAAAAARFTDKS